MCQFLLSFHPGKLVYKSKEINFKMSSIIFSIIYLRKYPVSICTSGNNLKNICTKFTVAIDVSNVIFNTASYFIQCEMRTFVCFAGKIFGNWPVLLRICNARKKLPTTWSSYWTDWLTSVMAQLITIDLITWVLYVYNQLMAKTIQ